MPCLEGRFTNRCDCVDLPVAWKTLGQDLPHVPGGVPPSRGPSQVAFARAKATRPDQNRGIGKPAPKSMSAPPPTLERYCAPTSQREGRNVSTLHTRGEIFYASGRKSGLGGCSMERIKSQEGSPSTLWVIPAPVTLSSVEPRTTGCMAVEARSAAQKDLSARTGADVDPCSSWRGHARARTTKSSNRPAVAKVRTSVLRLRRPSQTRDDPLCKRLAAPRPLGCPLMMT
jgi:hypothetical protein